MNKLQPFHLAIPVSNLEEARQFYREILGCKEGRSDSKWVDFDFFGHQFVIHHAANHHALKNHNPVDGHDVPVPHFGVVLDWEQWHDFVEDLKRKNVAFAIEPCIRFQGQAGEQATMFFYDPSGNALEFKAFKDINQLFATAQKPA
jgi:extradiol dioxygenase family protein